MFPIDKEILFSISIISILFLKKSFAGRRTRMKDYSGYQVYQVNVTDAEQMNRLHEVFLQLQADIWKEPSSYPDNYDLMLRKKDVNALKDSLGQIKAPYTLLIENVQSLIKTTDVTHRKRHRRQPQPFRFDRYNNYRKIFKWMRNFARLNSDIVSMFPIGITYEGKKIVALQIGNRTRPNKPTFWQDSLIHPREWITGATLLWVANRLIQGYRNNEADIVELLNRLDWLMVPVWNVDGYIHTWTKDRLWRKSRSVPASMRCRGVDLNRNFYTPNRGIGKSSDYVCSDVYHGMHPFSEPETKSVGAYLKRLNIAAFISIHSYSQLWLFPFGHTSIRSIDYADLEAISLQAVQAIHGVHGTTYRHGAVSEVVYKVSGGSLDWAHSELCVKYSFAIELRDRGRYAFLLPQEEIIPTAEEYFAALKVMGEHVMSSNSTRSSVCDTL